MLNREQLLEQRIRDLERVLDVSVLLVSTLDLQSVLTRILEGAMDLMEAEASAFFLVDEATKEIVCEVASGGANALDIPRLRPGQGIVGRVVQTGTTIRIEDAYQSPLFSRDVDAKTGFRTRSVLCVPLIAHGVTVGAGEVINKRGGQTFSDRDQQLFEAFCISATMAIQNAHMHRQVVAQRLQERELELARAVQQSFLPTAFPEVPGVEVRALSIPAWQVGGDVYDARRCGDTRLALYMGDVSGKGISAALYAARFQAEIAHYMASGAFPADVLRPTNRALAQWGQRGMFLTLAYVDLDVGGRRLRVTNAGHPEPLIRGANGTVERFPRAAFPPLGIVPTIGYTDLTLSWPTGSTLVLYSDGVIEARDPDGEFFGVERLMALLESLDEVTPENVVHELQRFVHTRELHDDVAVMTVRFR